jgi:hypothetical protein
MEVLVVFTIKERYLCAPDSRCTKAKLAFYYEN